MKKKQKYGINNMEIVGYIAGVLSILTYVPQIIKLYKIKKTEGLSILTVVMICISVLLWLCYGIVLNNVPMIVTNALICLMTLSILVMIYMYKK